MRLNQSIIYEKVCESLERDRVYLQPALSLSGLSVIVGTAISHQSCPGRSNILKHRKSRTPIGARDFSCGSCRVSDL